MQRRDHLFALSAAGLTAGAAAAAAGPEPTQLLLAPNGAMPNSRHAVLLYRGLLRGERELADKLEALVRQHGWEPQWRNGVYPFHHYHSTAHEVLAFSRGEARLLLGGEPPIGREIVVRAGDVALLPCGTGHCRVSASADFAVSGAYALGQSWDVLREAPDAEVLRRMKDLPYPKLDPAGQVLKGRWR